MSNLKQEAEDIVKAWTRYADYLENTDYEFKIDNSSMHDEFVSYLDGKLFTNKELVQEICKKGEVLLTMHNIRIAEFCVEELRNDRSTALAMVYSCNQNFELIDERFKDDKEFVLDALKEENVLRYVSERLKNDDQVVYFAVEKNSKEICFANDRFQTDKSFVLEILKKDNYIIEFMHKELKKDAAFLLDCWKIIGARCSDSHVLLHGHAKGFIHHMSDELKPFFNHVYLEGPNYHLNEQMLIGFNKYLLHKELNQELNTNTVNKNKRVKI